MKTKDPKLIREIKEIINNPDTHFWIKCKLLVGIETYNRPGSWKGDKLKREFFETCAGRFKDRFESAYVRPYLDSWGDVNVYDYVNSVQLNNDKSLKIGRNPRGIGLIQNPGSNERFARYLRAKFPDAFKTFEEIMKIEYFEAKQIKKTNYYAWRHIFGDMWQYYYRDRYLKVTKDVLSKRRETDLAMEKAQVDYNDLKKASKLPSRYLYNEVSLAELQNSHKNHTYSIFRKLYITTETVLSYDDSEVHHGLGKLVHTDRKVVIRNKRGVVFSKVLKTYAGNFILNAIEEYLDFKVEKIKIHEKLKPVQLNPKMRVLEKINTDNPHFRIFERTFAGIHYDYCVLRSGITYHGTTLKQCYVGWKKKKTLSKAGAKVLNMKSVRKALGFCREGILQFCADNNIDSRDDYTVSELKIIVNKNLSYNKTYYGQELQQVGVL